MQYPIVKLKVVKTLALNNENTVLWIRFESLQTINE